MLRLKLRERWGHHLGNKTLPTIAGVHALASATRYMEGGRERFIELMQLAVLNHHEDAEKWYAVYADLLLSERVIVSWDDVCAAAGVTAKSIISIIVTTAMEFGQDAGNLVAAVTHPEVVRQAAKSAKRIGGQFAEISYKDRQALFQHHGFIPMPKGTTVNVHANASASAKAAAVAAADPSMPSFAATMASLEEPRKTIQTQLALPAVVADPETDLVVVPDAELVEVE